MRTTSTPTEILRALGMAWSTYELYPNPKEQEAFRAAVDRLRDAHSDVVIYEIGAGRIMCGGDELEFRQGAMERLALRLFVHDVETLELIGAPSEHELDVLFSQLAKEEQQVIDAGGIARALADAQVASIGIIQRGILTDVETIWSVGKPQPDEEAEDGPGIVDLVNSGATPHAIATAIVTAAKGDVDKMASVFIKSYQVVHQIAELVEADVATDLEKMLAAYRQAPNAKSPLVTFVEAFFLLPQGVQARIMEVFLRNADQTAYRLLIDQFAGLDLVELAQLLSPEAHEQLSKYIRDVVDADSGTAEELLPLVESGTTVEHTKTGLSERIASMLNEVERLEADAGETREGLQAELMPERAADLGIAVVRGLFECETRADRFSRLVKTWVTAIGTAINNDDLDRAQRLLNAGTEGHDHSGFRTQAIEEALAAVTASNYSMLIDRYQQHPMATVELISAFGPASVDRLITRLALEESPAVRRGLIGLIGEVGRNHPEPILAHLKDTRWYLVRNLVSVLAKVGNTKGFPHLEALTKHEDERVVSEALRAMAVLNPDKAIPHLILGLAVPGRVSETATILLRTSSSEAIDTALASALTDKNLPVIARSQAVWVLRDRGTETSRTQLREIASMGNSLSPTKRRARRAARAALEEAA